MTKKIVSRIALGAAVALTLTTAPAGASITIPSFSVTPSSTSVAASPNLAFDSKYATPDGDTVKNASTTLPVGLLLDPTAIVAPCTGAQLSTDTCPAGSAIGSATTSGTLGGAGVSAAGTLYLVAPQAGELARLGIVSHTPLGNVSSEATVTGSPASGLTISFTNIPKTQFGAAIVIKESQITIRGSVGGKAFTRNPKTCKPATSTLTAVSWNDPAPVTARSTFRPTGCSAAKGRHKKHKHHTAKRRAKHRAKRRSSKR